MSTPAKFHDNFHQTEGGEQVVLILVGLVGSGKSTFAQALENHLPHRFRRCNQDDLGDRRKVENLARRTLREGLSVCIDRTNFNALQRSYWINIAREFHGTVVWVIVFETPYEVCAARLRERTFHPTIKSPQQGLSILARFANDFQPPSPLEGHDRLIVLRPSDHPSPIYTSTEIIAILQNLQASVSPSAAASTDSHVRGGNYLQLNSRPQARRATPHPIYSRGQRVSFRNRSVAPAPGSHGSGSTAGGLNDQQRAAEI